MANNTIQFPLADNIGNPLTASKAVLQLYYAPISASQFLFPISTYSDNNGTASYSDVITGVYTFKFSNANAQYASSGTYINQGFTQVYLIIPDIEDGSTISNGFQYIFTGSIDTGSIADTGTMYDLGIDLAGMTSNINRIVNDWAMQYGGISFVSWETKEKINYGFDNCIGPKCMVSYKNEDVYGDDVIGNIAGWVIRHFNISIERQQNDTQPKYLDLVETVGAARPFFTLVEELRDYLRAILLPSPSCYGPVIYEGMSGDKEDEFMTNRFTISIGIICQIPRVQFYPSQLVGGNGPYINLAGY